MSEGRLREINLGETEGDQSGSIKLSHVVHVEEGIDLKYLYLVVVGLDAYTGAP